MDFNTFETLFYMGMAVIFLAIVGYILWQSHTDRQRMMRNIQDIRDHLCGKQ